MTIRSAGFFLVKSHFAIAAITSSSSAARYFWVTEMGETSRFKPAIPFSTQRYRTFVTLVGPLGFEPRTKGL